MSRRGLFLESQRETAYYRQDARCAFCGMPMVFTDFELAHVLADSRDNVKKFGREVIDHQDNKMATHRGGCNSGILLGPDSISGREHAERIAAKVEAGYE